MDNGALGVPGAHGDVERMTQFIYNNMDKITNITFVCNEHGVAYSEDRIKYQCGLGNVCFYNSNISIPIDGNIRIYSYQKQAFKDFECEAVSPDSCLIKDSTSFTIVNDENIYRLVRTAR